MSMFRICFEIANIWDSKLINECMEGGEYRHGTATHGMQIHTHTPSTEHEVGRHFRLMSWMSLPQAIYVSTAGDRNTTKYANAHVTIIGAVRRRQYIL